MLSPYQKLSPQEEEQEPHVILLCRHCANDGIPGFVFVGHMPDADHAPCDGCGAEYTGEDDFAAFEEES